MKKRISTILLALLMLAATACNGSTPAAEAESTTTTAAEDYTEAPLGSENYAVVSNNGTQFVNRLKVGWSLGNTFDATSSGLSAETSWCGIKTTEQMIKDIHAGGFETIRIPVSWHNHVDEDFNIDVDWINRVQEVVDYAINDGMYVVINIHHDNEKGYMYPDAENEETSLRYVTKIWEQVSAKFISYDEHLVFEGLNEPRLKGTNYEWSDDVNNEEIAASIKIIDRLNQAFVDTVRASGGNNATRYLMVPSYCAKAAATTAMTLPTDIDGNENRIIVSIHAYSPYQFALNTKGTDRWRADKSNCTSEIQTVMETAYNNFTSKGIPVIIGECGAMAKDNTEARIAWTEYYFGFARDCGITCFWWDNNARSSGETFCIYNRTTGEWEYPEIIDAIMRVCE